MSTQTPLYSTEAIRIRDVEWRFAIDAQTGRGGYEWRKHQPQWQSLHCYPHRTLGLVTLNQLDRALYQPNRNEIATARTACVRVAQAFQLTTQQMAHRQFSLL